MVLIVVSWLTFGETLWDLGETNEMALFAAHDPEHFLGKFALKI